MYQKEKKTEYQDGQIIWHPTSRKAAIVSEGKRLVLTEVPEWLTPENSPREKVSLGISGSELKSVKPIAGMFRVKFLEFTAKEGEQPTPKEGTNYGGKESALWAYGLFEMQDENWKGNIISVKFEYSRFEQDADGRAYVGGVSKGANLLITFMIGVGFGLNNPIAYKPNMLPEIQKRADKNRVLTLEFSKGWPVQFSYEEDLSGVAWDDEPAVAETDWGDAPVVEETAGNELDGMVDDSDTPF